MSGRDQGKKTKKRLGFITSLFSGNTGEPIPEAFHYEQPGVALEDREAVHRLFIIIDTLPDAQRTVIILTKIDDRSIKEVSEIMQISPKAVESLLQCAKNNFSKKFGKTE